MKSAKTEMKNWLEFQKQIWVDRRKNQWIWDYPAWGAEGKKNEKNGQSPRDLWNTIKHTNIHRIKKKENQKEQLKEIMAKTPKFDVRHEALTQEAQWTPSNIKSKRYTLRHIITKLSKSQDKERILKAARERQLLRYKGLSIKLTADFSWETMEARGSGWQT